jgi:hypothetical protein
MIPGWKDEIEGAYVAFLKKHPKATPAQLAAHLGVQECCVIYWLTDMARDGLVRILDFELVEEGERLCAPETPLTCQRTALCPAERAAEFLPGGSDRPGTSVPSARNETATEPCPRRESGLPPILEGGGQASSVAQQVIQVDQASTPNDRDEEIGMCWLADAMRGS